MYSSSELQKLSVSVGKKSRCDLSRNSCALSWHAFRPGGCDSGAGDAVRVQMVPHVREVPSLARGAGGVLRPTQEHRDLGDVEWPCAFLEHLWNKTAVDRRGRVNRRVWCSILTGSQRDAEEPRCNDVVRRDGHVAVSARPTKRGNSRLPKRSSHDHAFANDPNYAQWFSTPNQGASRILHWLGTHRFPVPRERSVASVRGFGCVRPRCPQCMAHPSARSDPDRDVRL